MNGNPIDEVLAKWRMAHDQTGSASSPTEGYRRCNWPGCPTQIENSQVRRHCYFHGGKPGRDPLWE